MPWDSAIAASTKDWEFWSAHFNNKALKNLAAGRHTGLNHAVEITDVPHAGGENPTKRSRRSGRDRAFTHLEGGNFGDTQAKRSDGRWYLDPQGGRRFCQAYHHRNGCAEPCSDGRGMSHRCEFCLATHRSTECWKKPPGWQPPQNQYQSGAKGGGKGKGKGKKGKKGEKRTW